MEWNQKNINLGTLKQGEKVRLQYKAIDNISTVKEVRSSCGCTTPYWDKENETLTAFYTPKKIPKHLVSQGYYNQKGTITVIFLDGKVDTLTFSAKIIK